MSAEPRAFICGCQGLTLSGEETAFLRRWRPWGLILFRRNVADRRQIAALVDAFRHSVGRPDAPVLVDQEGGRVQRLGPPLWSAYPAASTFTRVNDDPAAQARGAYLAARLIAHDLTEVGITIDCLPVLDVPAPGSHAIIGDRAYAADPDAVAQLGRSRRRRPCSRAASYPVFKHAPGHGRARSDSHLELPRVDASRAELESRGISRPSAPMRTCPIAMTAHVVFERARSLTAPPPCRPSIVRTISSAGISASTGLLVSDDLSMKALAGPFEDSSQERLFAAGVDIALHCNG